jgi:hypothetical protein
MGFGHLGDIVFLSRFCSIAAVYVRYFVYRARLATPTPDPLYSTSEFRRVAQDVRFRAISCFYLGFASDAQFQALVAVTRLQDDTVLVHYFHKLLLPPPQIEVETCRLFFFRNRLSILLVDIRLFL